MASTFQPKSFTMLTRYKLHKSKNLDQTVQVLNNLLKQPNLTITSSKTKVIENIFERTKNNYPLDWYKEQAKVEPKPDLNKYEQITVNAKPEVKKYGQATSKPDLNKFGLTISKPDLNKSGQSGSKPEVNKYGQANHSKPELNKSRRNKQTPRKIKTKRRINIKQIEEDGEYYPNKLKRKFSSKKIVLKPKHDYKVVAVTNKRKRCTPVKDAGMDEEVLINPIVTMEELILEESLSEEDFLEILTCPSPVWWEDPPDETFTEDAIDVRFPESQETITETLSETAKPRSPNNQDDTTDQIVSEFQNNNLNVFQPIKFLQKRSKLENVLGNIKKAKTSQNASVSQSTDEEISLNDEDLLRNLENIEIPIDSTSVSLKNYDVTTPVEDKIALNEIKKEIDEEKDQINKMVISNVVSVNNELVNEIIDNSSINNEPSDKTDVLECNINNESKESVTQNNLLEEIKTEPQAKITQKKQKLNSPKKQLITKSYLKTKNAKVLNKRNVQQNLSNLLKNLKNDAQVNVLNDNDKNDLKRDPSEKKKKKKKGDKFSIRFTNKSIVKLEKNKNKLANILKRDKNAVPVVLPKLVPKNKYSDSPKSIHSFTSDFSENDTISDTNIQFIDEYDDTQKINVKSDDKEMNDMINDVKTDDMKMFDKNNSELVTVYQIVDKSDKKTDALLKGESKIVCSIRNNDIEKNNAVVDSINEFNLMEYAVKDKVSENCDRLAITDEILLKNDLNPVLNDNNAINSHSLCKNEIKVNRISNIITKDVKISKDDKNLSKNDTVSTENNDVDIKQQKKEPKPLFKILPNIGRKYCYNCSTIFSTETCLYCLKKLQLSKSKLCS